VLEVLYHHAKFGGARISPAAGAANNVEFFSPIANLKGHYFQPSVSVSLSVCVCVCLCVSDRHFYPSTLTDFNETWSQGPYSDLVWPLPQWSRSAAEGLTP